MLADVDDDSFQEALKTCKHIFVDSGMENGRNRVFNFPMDSLNTNLLNKKLNLVFGSFKCGAKLNVAFGFVLKKMRDGSCRYYYPHENITLMEGSKLVDTKEILKKIETSFNNVDAIESYKTERTNTK